MALGRDNTMINLNEPNYYGIGQGAAQVIDLSQINNTYNRLLQTRMIQDQRDGAAINEMTSQYDPNKQNLRSEDINDYNNKFTQWKSLYLNNKNLARNPASNPELYKKAEQLRNEMAVLAKESKEVYHSLGEVSTKYKQNEDAFDQSAVQKMNLFRNLPTNKIKEVNGGQLPQWGDFELKYNPIDDKAAQDFIQKQAAAAGLKPQENVEVLKVGDGRNGLPQYENQVRIIQKYPPEFIGHLADTYALSYPNELKSYNQQFRNMPPENIAAVKEQVKKDFGVDMEIKNGRDLQHATWVMKYGKQWAGDKIVKDKAAEDAAKEVLYQKHRGERKADQKDYARYTSALIASRARQREEGSGEDDFINAYNKIDAVVSGKPGAGYNAADLDSESAGLVNGLLNSVGSDYSPGEVFLVKGEDNKVRIYKKEVTKAGMYNANKKNLITTIDPTRLNIVANKDLGIKEKNKAAKSGKQTGKQPTKGKTYKGIDANGNPIFE